MIRRRLADAVAVATAARFADRPAYAAAVLHSGHIGDSVTWLVVGMAAFGTLLALVVR